MMTLMRNSNSGGKRGLEMVEKKDPSPPEAAGASAGAAVEGWELRPCGMLVQKRDPDSDSRQDPSFLSPLIRLKISFGRSTHHVSINANSTFGELKKALIQETGLQPKQQRLLYHGKEKKDTTCLSEVGVKNKSKIVLVEDAASWERRLVELRKNEATAKACKAVSEAQQVVDKFSGKIADIEASILGGKHISDSELMEAFDLLMYQLVILDASKVEGETNVKKTILVRRVQKYVEKLDALKVKNDQIKPQSGLDFDSHSREDGSQGLQNGISTLRSYSQNDRVRESSIQNRISKDSGSNNIKNEVTRAWEAFGMRTESHNRSSAKPPLPINASAAKPPLPINASAAKPPLPINASAAKPPIAASAAKPPIAARAAKPPINASAAKPPLPINASAKLPMPLYGITKPPLSPIDASPRSPLPTTWSAKPTLAVDASMKTAEPLLIQWD